MREYTVIGVIEDGSGELIIAGVVEGTHDMADAAGWGPRGFQRWASHCKANDYSEAILMALTEFDKEAE